MNTCPEWCNGQDDGTDDVNFVHRSDPHTVPVVERVPDGEGGFGAASSTDLIIGLERINGDTWVWIGPDEDVHRSLVLTEESARRLSRTLIALLSKSRA
ncbi:DUF6907 domain-containing protein [Microbacterium sp. CFBP 8790]|uniref:DUF6907 domain-containing protein n=1 Tax=unclassified Microbacterium TaxID=2609290 RepID=UPI003F884CFE